MVILVILVFFYVVVGLANSRYRPYVPSQVVKWVSDKFCGSDTLDKRDIILRS